MEFNVSKCKIVHYARKNLCHKHTIDGQSVEEVDKEKDLGIHSLQSPRIWKQLKIALRYTARLTVCLD